MRFSHNNAFLQTNRHSIAKNKKKAQIRQWSDLRLVATHLRDILAYFCFFRKRFCKKIVINLDCVTTTEGVGLHCFYSANARLPTAKHLQFATKNIIRINFLITLRLICFYAC